MSEIMLDNKSCSPRSVALSDADHDLVYDHELETMKEIQFKYLLFMLRLKLSMAINRRSLVFITRKSYLIFHLRSLLTRRLT